MYLFLLTMLVFLCIFIIIMYAVRKEFEQDFNFIAIFNMLVSTAIVTFFFLMREDGML